MRPHTLTICRAGTVRSVALAHLLKYVWGHDAIAAGVDTMSPETFGMLFDWADNIYPLEGQFAAVIPEAHRDKVTIFEVGEDRWGNPLNPELQNGLAAMAAQVLGPPVPR